MNVLEKKRAQKENKAKEALMKREDKEKRIGLYIASIIVPMASFVFGFFALEISKESTEKSMKLAIESHKENIEQANNTMELAIEHHNKSMTQSINALKIVTEAHKENMEQASRIHTQVLEENYNNLVHEQNRARYYETILLLSKSILGLQTELNFCNDFHVEIQQAFSDERYLYNSSLFFFGENFIFNQIEKKPDIDKGYVISNAMDELERKYKFFLYNNNGNVLFIEPDIVERIEKSEGFSKYLKDKESSIKFYEYVDRESEVYQFIRMQLDLINQVVRFKEVSDDEIVSETMLRLENEYTLIKNLSKVPEQIYVNYKQLGKEFSEIGDLLLHPDFNLFIKQHGISSALEHFITYEDPQFAQYKNTYPQFRSESEYFLYHYYDVLVWNLILSESVFDYMKQNSYEDHIANNNIIEDIFTRIKENIELQNAGNYFFIRRCESAFQKAKANAKRALPHIQKVTIDNTLANQKLLSSMFETIGHYLLSDFSEIEKSLDKVRLIGPDSIDIKPES